MGGCLLHVPDSQRRAVGHAEMVIGKRPALDLCSVKVKVSSLLCKQEHVLARSVSCLRQCAVAYRLLSALGQSLCGGKVP